MSYFHCFQHCSPCSLSWDQLLFTMHAYMYNFWSKSVWSFLTFILIIHPNNILISTSSILGNWWWSWWKRSCHDLWIWINLKTYNVNIYSMETPCSFMMSSHQRSKFTVSPEVSSNHSHASIDCSMHILDGMAATYSDLFQIPSVCEVAPCPKQKLKHEFRSKLQLKRVECWESYNMHNANKWLFIWQLVG